MKKLLCLLVALLGAAFVNAADQVPHFNAVVTIGKESRFTLISDDGKSSGWIRLGENFDGYTVKAFDPAKSVLTIERDGVASTLSLVEDALVKDAPVATGTKATLADAEHLLQSMRFEEMMGKLLEQQKKQSIAMAKQMTDRMPMAGVNKDDLAAFQEKLMTEVLSALNIGEMKKDIAQIYSEVFTKEELAAQANFYMTTAGMALVDKTPVVQARMQALMMPRMQAVMPKIGQLAQQFQAEQKAKAAAAAAAAAPAPAAPAAPTAGTK